MTLEDLVIERSGDHIRVDQSSWLTAAEMAKAEGYEYFCFLSGIDWLVNPGLDGEKHWVADRATPGELETLVDAEVRITGGESRFSVFGCVRDVRTNRQILIHADLDDTFQVPSWTSVYPGADWHEREAWEMYGFDFESHPGLRHIYLPDQFEGHPLRKDFALAARLVRPWPGLVDMEEIPKKPEEPASE